MWAQLVEKGKAALLGSYPLEAPAIRLDDVDAENEDAGLLRDRGDRSSWEVRRESLLELPSDPASPDPSAASANAISRVAFFGWVALNCVATLGLVLVNKKILSNPTLGGAPILFVAYHFGLTFATLHIASTSAISVFERKGAWLPQLPLALVFAGRTVITNWSLALLPVAVYQETRILVTPATVAINFLLYRKTITLQSFLALFVVCGGIGLTVWTDTRHRSPHPLPNPARQLLSRDGDTVFSSSYAQIIGYASALLGVFLSSLYSVWIGVYLPKYQLSSLQLLHLQAPLGCGLLLLVVPLLDTLPSWSTITPHEYLLLFISGLCAVLLNVSQFFIVAGSSALSSTVVAHFKTCLIVGVGWVTMASVLSVGSGVGIFFAMLGIIAYSAIELKSK